MVTVAGSLLQPWQLTCHLVTVSGPADASLLGNTTTHFQQGWFNYTDLAISHPGTYKLVFAISEPEAVSHLRAEVLLQVSDPQDPLTVAQVMQTHFLNLCSFQKINCFNFSQVYLRTNAFIFFCILR